MLAQMQETWVQPLGWKDTLGEGIATHSGILAWEIPWRSLVGYNPWGHKELETTKQLTHSCMLGYLTETLLNFAGKLHVSEA